MFARRNINAIFHLFAKVFSQTLSISKIREKRNKYIESIQRRKIVKNLIPIELLAKMHKIVSKIGYWFCSGQGRTLLLEYNVVLVGFSFLFFSLKNWTPGRQFLNCFLYLYSMSTEYGSSASFLLTTEWFSESYYESNRNFYALKKAMLR